MGAGPLTGRRAGYCAGFDAPGAAYPFPGHGMQFGYRRFGGGGRGWRHGYYATGLPGWMRAGTVSPTQEQEMAGLKNAAEDLKNQLDAIGRRIQELEQKE